MPKRRRIKRRRTKPAAVNTDCVTVIVGLKPGDGSLPHQAQILASLAYDFGRVDRRAYLLEAEKTVQTTQPIGRLFTFHRKRLVEDKFIRLERIPRKEWLQAQPAVAATA